MRVLKYIPSRMFGFLTEDGIQQVFFHLRTFRPGAVPLNFPPCSGCSLQTCDWASSAPPPIAGEMVDAIMESDPAHLNQTRAREVWRVDQPTPQSGCVETFDAHRGWGFIRGGDNHVYYLHRSEITEGRIPIIGQRVMFYVAQQQDKARACHVKVCLGVT
jgi:cold shock CspA family protein